jgi:hypothetical protein
MESINKYDMEVIRMAPQKHQSHRNGQEWNVLGYIFKVTCKDINVTA